jgi:hypothetical protein
VEYKESELYAPLYFYEIKKERKNKMTTNLVNTQFQAQYELLFRKAERLLVGEEDGTINSIQKYYSVLQDIIKAMEEDGNFDESYFLIPFDEPMFEINADTKEIKVPDSFKKGIAVQGDHAAEVIVFCIDRYFDYVDLSNDNIDIFVQYSSAEEEGMYQVNYKDITTYPGKLRFGWILSDKATATAGPLRFSVRFYSNDVEGTSYSLNTTTQTVNIYPALQKTVDKGKLDGLSSSSAFYKYVRNSLAEGQVPAQTPRFDDAEGKNLPITANLVDDTLTLSVRATKNDGGNIGYTWYYAPTGNDTASVIQSSPLTSSEEASYLTMLLDEGEGEDESETEVQETGYNIALTYEDTGLTVKDISGHIRPRVEYYVNTGSSSTPVYTKYTSAKADDNVTLSDTQPVYLQNTTLIIKPGIDQTIDGKYYVTAINTIDTNNISNLGASSQCIIPGLNQCNPLKQLSNTEGVIVDGTTTINFKEIYQADPGAHYEYALYRSVEWGSLGTEVGNTRVEGIVDSTGKIELNATFVPSTGIYYFDIEIDKNRYSQSFEKAASDITIEGPCLRVTEVPDAPTFTITVNNTIASAESFYSSTDGYYRIPSSVDNDLGALKCDYYKYRWEMLKPDTGVYVPLSKESYIVDNSYDQATLIINPNADVFKLTAISVRCKVTAHLNGKDSAESAIGQAYYIMQKSALSTN